MSNADSSRDMDQAVQKHMGQYRCDFVLIDKQTDKLSDMVIYKYQTKDDLQIVFEVSCFVGNTMLPFGFEIPKKKLIVKDNFPEQICAYMGGKEGHYCVDDKSIEEISDYVMDVMEQTEILLQEYGVMNRRPRIVFTLTKDDKEYLFPYTKSNEVILRDGLQKTLFY